jgi:hypothetical protein
MSIGRVHLCPRAAAVFFFATAMAGCYAGVHVVHKVAVVDVPRLEPGEYGGRSKVQLYDGSVVLFRRGISLDGRYVTGEGIRHSLDGTTTAVARVSLDSVVSAQAFLTQVDAGRTASQSAFGTIAGTAAVLLGCDDCGESGGDYERSGRRARDLPYASEPVGAGAVIQFHSGVTPPCSACVPGLRGELLAVEDGGLLLLRQSVELVSVPFAAVAKFSLEGVGEVSLSEPAGRQRARLISRFPAGVQPTVRAQLEAMYGGRPAKL